MQFLNLFRFRCSGKAKHAATIFPSNWPSYLHSKCTTPTCWFPNPPQAAAGTYNCQARSGGSSCKGTYNVTSAMAASMIKNYAHKRRVEEAGARERKAVDADRPTREPEVKKRSSKRSIFKGKSHKPLKETLQKQEYLNNKSLPSIPGLSQRKVNRPRFSPQSPPLVETTDDLKPFYPRVVMHYYFPQDQLSNPAHCANSTDPRKPGLISSHPLAPQRRPRSGNYNSNTSGSSLPQQRSDQNLERHRYYGQPYRNHRF